MKAKNKLGLAFFPAFDWAISPSHPEREERLLYTQDQLYEEGLEDIEGIDFYNHKIATAKDIERTHFVVPSVDRVVSKSHLVSIGATIRAFNLVLNKEVDKAFAMVRPPGHHAFRMVYGDRGFCIVNIEAVALENIRQKQDLRVAIIDTDAHHGDGTEDIYWNDPNTLFISLHQDGRTLFPGTGFMEDMGGPGAYGCNINIPLPPYTSDEGILYIIENVVLPILDDYKPDLIINSAGQDNHYSDPLTHMNVSAQGYAKLNELLDPQLAVLEGGYSIEGALPYVNLAIVLAMAGLDYSKVIEPDYNPSKLKESSEIKSYIKEISKLTIQNWKNREALAKRKFASKKSIVRNKRIYYDTDHIMENQKEEIKVCPNCSGLIKIESSASTGLSALALTIPRDACKDCQQEGYDIFERSQKSYDHIYLQDKKRDKYLSK